MDCNTRNLYNRALPEAYLSTYEVTIYGREGMRIGYIEGRTIKIGSWGFSHNESFLGIPRGNSKKLA